MTNQPFRFLHAADLHLEIPVTGLADAPDHLAERIFDAPRKAAEAVFEAALAEKVDFVLLTGDLLAPALTGPWGPLFFVEQFEKLRLEGIPVYWAAGKADEPEDWPTVVPLPENVHLFPVGEVEEVVLSRDGVPFARILGTSLGKLPTAVSSANFPADPDGLYSIGALYGKPHPDSLKATSLQYWALGGEHRRDFPARNPSMIHYPGVTLSRSPADGDDCGVSLVEVNEFGRTNVRLLKTSPIRWTVERVVVRDELDEEAVLGEMRSRLQNIRKTLGDILLFVSWRFDVPVNYRTDLRYANLAPTMLRDLRSEFGKEAPFIWSLDLEPILPDLLDPDDCDQQTILGDYLRMIHFYQENSDDKIDLADFFSEELTDYQTARVLREKRLREATIQRENSADTPETSELTLPEKAFRGEVPELIRLLSLAPEDQPGWRRGSGEADEAVRREIVRKIAPLRIAALREAAAFGTELLSGRQEEIRQTTNVPVLKNPKLAEERRFVQNYLDGKENRS